LESTEIWGLTQIASLLEACVINVELFMCRMSPKPDVGHRLICHPFPFAKVTTLLLFLCCAWLAANVQTFTDVYRRLQTFTDVYRRLQTFTDVYRRLQTFTDVYRRLLIRRLLIKRNGKGKNQREKEQYEKHSQFNNRHRTYRVVTLSESNFWQRETDGERADGERAR
jgi:hypothetical protein